MRLKIEVRGPTLQFFYAPARRSGGNWQPVGPVLDASLLSDECGGHAEHGSFTGAFVGMACSDLNGTAQRGDVLRFRLSSGAARERPVLRQLAPQSARMRQSPPPRAVARGAPHRRCRCHASSLAAGEVTDWG